MRLSKSTKLSKLGAAVAVLAICAAGAAGCASKTGGIVVAAPSSAPPTASGDPMKLAEQAGNTLMSAFDRLPAATKDATMPPGAPDGVAAWPPQAPTAYSPVELVGFWTVDAASSSAFASAKALMPHWGNLSTSDSTVGGVPVNEVDASLTGKGALALQSVTAQAEPLSSSRTVVRVDVVVAWRPTRPAASYVPTTSELTVTQRLFPGPATSSSHQVVIKDQATITRIASVINALPVMPTYMPMNCPMITVGSGLDLVFQDSGNGPAPVDVTVDARPSSQCGGSMVVDEGGKRTYLDDSQSSPALYLELEQLAGFPVQLG